MTRAQLFTLEQQTIEPIPLDARYGKARGLFAIWFGMNMTPLTVVTGATASAVFGLSLWWSLLAIVVGNAIGGVGMALHAAQGPKLAVPQMLQARGQFGSYGASIVVLIAIIMFVGYFSSNLLVASKSVVAVFPSANSAAVIVICSILSLAITAYGYALVRVTTAISTYIVGALVLLSFATLAVKGTIGHVLGLGRFHAVGFFAMLAIGVVWQLTYAPYVSDYSRYMPQETGARGSFWGSYLGCVLSTVLLMTLGVIVGSAVTGTDTMPGLRGLLGGALGFVVLIGFAFSAAAGNSVNAYCSSLCVLTLIETFAQGWRPALRARLATTLVLHLAGALIALAAASSFATSYFNFLNVVLYLLIPWSAVNLVDYYLIRHADYAVDDFFAAGGGRYGRWNTGALAVFVLGVVAQIPFISTTFYTGPIATALGGVDIAWLVGLVVSGLCYIVVARVAPRSIRLEAPAAVNHKAAA
jgi:NCS1 family nucleobase:cation symporter-1